MHYYAVFGGCLRSDLELPELPAMAPSPPDWTFHVANGESPLWRSQPVVGPDRAHRPVELYINPEGWCIFHPYTGAYQVAADGRDITWYPVSHEWRQYVGAVVVGPALALALHAAGVLCLHGSAVSIERHGVAFLAPKHYGKSTLALALLARGAKLITDDTVAVDLPAVTVRPGVHCLRLHQDSATELKADRLAANLIPGAKNTLGGLPGSMVMNESVSLASVYVLQPARAAADRTAAARTPASPLAAARALMHFTKLGPLFSPNEAATLLGRVTGVAQAVNVYSLRVARDFRRLDEVADQIVEWESGPYAASRGRRVAS